MPKPVLQIIIASTRPGRVGAAVGEWFAAHAREHGGYDVELVDLAEVNLPFLDEPHHPRLRKYTKEHTQRWSATVDRADAFAFVIPEYNYGFNAAIKNALDFLHNEWQYKPVAFVSYGGVAAGTRAVQMLKQVVTALKMYPLAEAVSIPFVNRFLDSDRHIKPDETMEAAATLVLAELARLASAMRSLRVSGLS